MDTEILSPEQQQAVAIMDEAQAITVYDQASLVNATDFISRVVGCRRALDDQRRSYTDPLRQKIEEINDRYRWFIGGMDEARGLLEPKIIAYQQEQEKEAEIAQREALERARKETEETGIIAPLAAEEMQAPGNVVRADAGKVVGRHTPSYKIIDPELVPKGYWMINEKAIAAAVRGGVRAIPGVEIFSVDKLAVTLKR